MPDFAATTENAQLQGRQQIHATTSARMTRGQVANLLYHAFFSAALLWMAACITFRMGESRAECLFYALLGGAPLLGIGWAIRYALTRRPNQTDPPPRLDSGTKEELCSLSVPKEPVMFRAVIQETAALASISLFVGMLAIWSQVLGNL